MCTSNQRLTSSDNCCLKFSSPCDYGLIQLPLKSPWLSLALRKWPFKCDLFSNKDWSKSNLRFFPTRREMENQFLGALSSFATNWFPDPCGWERRRGKSTWGMANIIWVCGLLYHRHSPQVHVVVEFSPQRVHFCKQQTGIMASPQGTSLQAGSGAEIRVQRRNKCNLLPYHDLLQGNNTLEACLDGEGLPLCSLRHCSLQGESKAMGKVCRQRFEKGTIFKSSLKLVNSG